MNIFISTFSIRVLLLSLFILPNLNGQQEQDDLCNVSSFMMYLKSGTRTSSQEEFSERNLVQSLHSGDYVCTEYNWGDNIEAVVDGNSSCINTTKMNFVLKDLDKNNKVVANHTERHHPFFMFANNKTIVYGKTLDVGRYQLTVKPFRRFPKFVSAPSESIDFDMIDCYNYDPPNQCSKCPYDPMNRSYTCDGSMCLKDEYLRFTLISVGWDFYDFGLRITTPGKRVLGAYGSEMTDLPDGMMTSDPFFSGGYVDQDFHYGSCRSYGHWIKSIVFPHMHPYTKRPIDTGTYQIQLEDLDICDFHSDVNIVNTNPFVLKIYQNHTLIHSYTSGRSFTYTLV